MRRSSPFVGYVATQNTIRIARTGIMAAAPSIPTGLVIAGTSSVIGLGAMACTTMASASTNAVSQATGRQREKTNLPVGKSSGRNVAIRPQPRVAIYPIPSHAMTSAPGSEPSRVRSA